MLEKWRKPAFAAFLVAWFVYFSWDGLRVHFAPDDMMNIDSFYWTPGPWRLVYSQFLIWRGYYRPMGGLFYLPILAGWGLNPVPYHVTLSLVLLANVCLVYCFARRLGCGELAAGLAALVACYHAGIANLYYNTAFVYDALCGFFYLGALVYYIRIRARGRLLRPGETLVFTALLVCALNSKEMALTLPAVLLAYEWVYHPPIRHAKKELADWLRGPGRTSMIAGALTLVDLYGKMYGHDQLTGPGYTPVFSWDRLLDFQTTFLRDVLFLHAGFSGVVAFWLVVTYLAWRPAARPVLRFCWLFLLLTPLPIEFLPGKSQACLYIPMLGATVFASVVFVDWAWALASGLTAERLFRRFSRGALLTGILLVALFYWGRENLHNKRTNVTPVMTALGRQTWEVIEQFRALHPQVRPGSHVVFMRDPFQEWDMLFIADLWFRDRSVTVRLQRLTPLAPEQIARSDYLYDYSDGKLLRVK